MPVSQVVTSDFVLLVNPQKVPARNVPDFVAWARQRKELFIATFGAGTPGHFGAFMFGNAVQLKPEPVHYKNTNDALGGPVQRRRAGRLRHGGPGRAPGQGGKLTALGSTGATRTQSMPELPTIREQGYPSLEFNSWFGVVAPAKTPPEIVARLQADIVRALQQPDSRSRLEEAGFRVTGNHGATNSPASCAPTRSPGARPWRPRGSRPIEAQRLPAAGAGRLGRVVAVRRHHALPSSVACGPGRRSGPAG